VGFGVAPEVFGAKIRSQHAVLILGVQLDALFRLKTYAPLARSLASCLRLHAKHKVVGYASVGSSDTFDGYIAALIKTTDVMSSMEITNLFSYWDAKYAVY
jgi:hypothetical protein